MEKPPLFLWLTALMYQLFGISEFSARLVGALCGIATILLTFEIGRRMLDEWVGFIAALILLTNGFFLFILRYGGVDMPLTFCVVLAAYGYLRMRQGELRACYIAAHCCPN